MPSLIVMAAGCAMLALADDTFSVTCASALLGVGNALSSGLVQTVGQDAAPTGQRARSKFLGLFKVATDCGTFVGPMAVGLTSHSYGLDAASKVIAAATCGCALWYALLGRDHANELRASAAETSPLPHKQTAMREHEPALSEHMTAGGEPGMDPAHDMEDGDDDDDVADGSRSTRRGKSWRGASGESQRTRLVAADSAAA